MSKYEFTDITKGGDFKSENGDAGRWSSGGDDHDILFIFFSKVAGINVSSCQLTYYPDDTMRITYGAAMSIDFPAKLIKAGAAWHKEWKNTYTNGVRNKEKDNG